MGYDIHAVGVIKKNNGNGYRYPNFSKTNRMWGGEWELNKIVDTAISVKGFNTGGSITGGVTVGLMKRYAISTLKRLIGANLHFLSMEAQGTLSIYTRNTNLIMPDEVDFKKFNITPSNVSSQFKSMLKHMDKVGLNHTGPLIDICNTLSGWSGKGKSGTYNLSFAFEWS